MNVSLCGLTFSLITNMVYIVVITVLAVIASLALVLL